MLACYLDEVPGQLTEKDLEDIGVLQIALLVRRLNMCRKRKQVFKGVLAVGTCDGLDEGVSGGFPVLFESMHTLESFSIKTCMVNNALLNYPDTT